MRKQVFALSIVLLFSLALVAAGAPNVDPYADAVLSSKRTSNAGNAVGAPDGAYASIRGGGQLILDMGEGEEIYGGPYGADDFKIIEVDGWEWPDCASIGVWISDGSKSKMGGDFEWVGISCSSNGFELPNDAVVRYVKIKNHLGAAYEVDAIVADYYLPDNVPEFGVLAAIGVLGLAGLFIYRRRD